MTLQDFKTRQGVFNMVNGKTIRLHEWDNITFSDTGVITLLFDFENGNDIFARSYFYDLATDEVYKVKTWNFK